MEHFVWRLALEFLSKRILLGLFSNFLCDFYDRAEYLMSTIKNWQSGILRKDNSVYSFPLVMALLQSKSKKSYIRLLRWLRQEFRSKFPDVMDGLMPTKIICDFELWLHNKVRQQK